MAFDTYPGPSLGPLVLAEVETRDPIPLVRRAAIDAPTFVCVVTLDLSGGRSGPLGGDIGLQARAGPPRAPDGAGGVIRIDPRREQAEVARGQADRCRHASEVTVVPGVDPLPQCVAER